MSEDYPPLTLTISDAYKDLETPVMVNEPKPNQFLEDLSRQFKSDVEKLGTKVVEVTKEKQGFSNVSDYIVSEAEKDKLKYMYNMLLAADFS